MGLIDDVNDFLGFTCTREYYDPLSVWPVSDISLYPGHCGVP